ncbi:MAG TPA: flagellar biosynthetic protein FliQ [Lachnospiraceae bacterium]|nr:flagellar biosynthetic protein FliQ [Lachnospiraceae bacterium]
MTEADLIEVTTQTIWTIIKCSVPLLLVSLIVGLIISIFQTVTSIQEQTLTFVPKLLAIFITLLLTGNWIMQSCVEFFTTLCESFYPYVK